MSSIGTERAYLLAMRDYKLALTREPRDQAECERLHRVTQAAYDIHQDYLRAERDDARAEANE